jgi:hypothetical protein
MAARPIAPPLPLLDPYPYPLLSFCVAEALALLDPLLDPPLAAVWNEANVWSDVGLTAKTMPDLQWNVQKNQTGLVSATV